MEGLCGDINDPIPQPTSDSNLFVYDPYDDVDSDGLWPPGLYGTDGSGGEHGSFPELRRCGVGISRLSGLDPPYQIQFAAHCALPGKIQTAPRSELFAFYLLVSKVSHGTLMIVSDSKINVDLFNGSRSIALVSVKSDLWRYIFEIIDSKSL